MQVPKNWIRSESVNLFKVICDMLDLLQDELTTGYAYPTTRANADAGRCLGFSGESHNGPTVKYEASVIYTSTLFANVLLFRLGTVLDNW